MNSSPAADVDFRRALEALRSGVPNRDALKVIGCAQPAVEQKFGKTLNEAGELLQKGKQAPGLLVTGDFGSGKSHLLEYLEHVALSQNFVCSRVIISKETPLYDPAKVYRSAIESAVVPGLTGQAIQEMALKFQPNSKEYAGFERWCNRAEGKLNPIFLQCLCFMSDWPATQRWWSASQAFGRVSASQ
jgi:hypothetical protein